MALFLTEADLTPLIDMADCVRVLDEAFAGWSDPARRNLARRRMPAGRSAMNVLGGALPGGEIFGLRTTVYGMDANTLALYSVSSGQAIAMMACNPISAARTGAASGVATRHLARADATTLGIIGAGRTARRQLEAVAAVRDLTQVKVFARGAERRTKFAKEMSAALGLDIAPVDTARAAAEGADILVTATNASEPVLFGEWLTPGQHINAIGANAMDRRELDNAAYLKADMICTDDRTQAQIEAGALTGLVTAGKLAWDEICELGEVVDGTCPGRIDPAQITLFNSLGIGFEDVAYGYALYLKARAARLGTEVAMP